MRICFIKNKKESLSSVVFTMFLAYVQHCCLDLLGTGSAFIPPEVDLFHFDVCEVGHQERVTRLSEHVHEER
jgi:hypothetical protein